MRFKWLFLILSFFSVLQAVPKGYVSNATANTVSVVDIDLDQVISPTIPTQSAPARMTILPDESKLYVINQGSDSVTVVNVITDTVITNISFGPAGDLPNDIACTPDGTKVFVVCIDGSGTGSVLVIDTSTDAVIATITMAEGLGEGCFRIKILPDGTKAYVTNSTSPTSQSISVINTSTFAVITTIMPGEMGPTNMALTPDGSQLFVCNFAGDSVTIINTGSDSVTTIIPLGALANPISVNVTPDGTKAFVCNQGTGTVSVINTSGYAVMTFSVGMGSQPQQTAFTLDGSKAFITKPVPNQVAVIDTSNNSIITNIDLAMGSGPNYITLVPGGEKFYVCNNNSNSVTVIDAMNNVILGLPIVTGANPEFIVFAMPGSPTNFSGSKGKNRFLTQTANVNILTWEAPLNAPQLLGYQIYRNAGLTNRAGTVGPFGPLVFVDGAVAGQAAIYYIVAVDINGTFSTPAVTTVP